MTYFLRVNSSNGDYGAISFENEFCDLDQCRLLRYCLEHGDIQVCCDGDEIDLTVFKFDKVPNNFIRFFHNQRDYDDTKHIGLYDFDEETFQKAVMTAELKARILVEEDYCSDDDNDSNDSDDDDDDDGDSCKK